MGVRFPAFAPTLSSNLLEPCTNLHKPAQTMDFANESPSRAGAKRLAAASALLLILIGGFEPFYLRVFTLDRAREEAAFSALPFRQMPGLQTFLQGVDARSPPGARIALWLPVHPWDGGYGYAY